MRYEPPEDWMAPGVRSGRRLIGALLLVSLIIVIAIMIIDGNK